MLIKKFLKANIKYLMFFILILTSSFSLSNVFMSNSSENAYMDVKRNIKCGEFYFVDADYMSREEYQEYFHSTMIPTCESNLHNKIYLNNEVLSTAYSLTESLPIFFMDEFDNEVAVIDYANFLYNNMPKKLNLYRNNAIQFSINQTEFSPIRGIFLSYDIYLDYDLPISYYAIKATKDNINLIAKFAAYNDNYKYIYDYGETLNNVYSNKSESINIINNQKLATYLSVALSFIYLVIFVAFLNKNRNDLYLLYINGYSKSKTMLFISVIPFVSVAISIILSTIISNIYILTYNALILKEIPAISFGRNNIVMLILATIIICFLSLFYEIYFKYCKLNRGDFND